ncbi:MAG: ribokinase [Clostridia bacterium]|nr:ribokinase [Clostridia bacterium]
MKILNFGSLNIDYVYSVEHLVQPGETIPSRKLEIFCGGKGLNQSVALARAGADVFHAGMVGSDGAILTERLRGAGADVSNVAVGSGVSGHAVIQVDRSGQNCILLHGGANAEIGPEFIRRVICRFGEGDILLLQNEISGIAEIMEAAHRQGLRIAFNPSPVDERIAGYPLEYVTWFILKEIEGAALSGNGVPDEITGGLLKKYPGSRVVLTLGRQGVRYSDGQVSAAHGIYPVKVVDTTAAGDTFTGYFLAGVLEELPIGETLRRASVASSIAVSLMGASNSIPALAQVLAFEGEPSIVENGV